MQFIKTPIATAVGVAEDSAVLKLDAMSNRFQIPLAAGQNGGRVENATMIDHASAASAIRLHLFHSQPSAYVTGLTFALANDDDDKYLGHIDFATWSTAGGSKMISQVADPGIAIFAQSGARNIWGVMEARVNMTVGDVVDPFRVSMTTRQDT